MLEPRPSICGKMNHIQWLRFRPAAELIAHSIVDGTLRIDEALQIERIVNARCHERAPRSADSIVYQTPGISR